MANLNAKNLQELEGFKAGYQKVLDENQIRFSKWHDAQADAIKELYKKLAQMKIALRHMVSPVKFFPPGVDSKEQIKKEEELFLELHESSHRFYEENKILIPEKHICKLEKLYDEVLSSMRSYGKSKNAGPKSSFEFAEQASDFAKSMEIILDDLRKDFRAILNGEDVQDVDATDDAENFKKNRK